MSDESTDKTVRFTLPLKPSLVRKLESYRKRHGLRSRAAAIRHMINMVTRLET